MALIPLLAATLLLPDAPPGGGTYHLAPDGSDAGDGSPARPWRTLAHAAARIPDDGSTVLLHDGVYEGLQTIARHFRVPATFRAAHPYRAVLRNPSGHRVLRIYDASNVVLDGLVLEGTPARGEYLVHIGTAGAHHRTVQNCILHDSHDNDLVKVNDRACFVTFRGNLFHNQNRKGGDEHLDLNTVTDITVEDNLFFNDFAGSGRAFGIKGARNVVFRANTVSGDLPCGGGCFAFRISREGANPVNDRIRFPNNLWSDPTGTMTDFADGPPEDATNVVLRRNLYWNGGKPLPRDRAVLNVPDDPEALTADPGLPDPKGLVLPRWDPKTGRFPSGSSTIRQEFERLALGYGAPPAGSPAIDAADPAEAPPDDLLGRPRPSGPRPDLGACEARPAFTRRRN